jgi:hypothetical protein
MLSLIEQGHSLTIRTQAILLADRSQNRCGRLQAKEAEREARDKSVEANTAVSVASQQLEFGNHDDGAILTCDPQLR